METERKPDRRELIAVVLLLCLGAALRLALPGAFPPGLNQDEASTGYDAWALLTAGTDRNGDAWPVLFSSWGSGQNALYAYLLLPFYLLFGRSVAVLRLPAAILGVLSLWLFRRLMRRSMGPAAGLCALGLLAVCPWHVLISRWALESNLLPFCLLLGTCLLDRALRDRPGCLIPAAGVLALGLYAYGTAFFFLPVYLILGCVLLFNRRFPLRLFIPALALFLLLALPIALCQLRNALGLESVRILGMTLPRLTETRQAAAASFSLRHLRELGRLLWTQSDGLPWNSAGPFGLLWGKPGLLLAAIGLGFTLVRCVRRQADAAEFLCLFALASCLFSALFIQINVNRINILFLPLVWLQAAGLRGLLGLLPEKGLLPAGAALCVLALLGSLALGRYCLRQQRAALEPAFHTGLCEAVAFAAEREGPVWITDEVNMPYIYVLFVTGPDPEEFLSTVEYADPDAPFRRVLRFGRWRFGRTVPKEGLCILGLEEARAAEARGRLRIAADFGLYAVAEAG